MFKISIYGKDIGRSSKGNQVTVPLTFLYCGVHSLKVTALETTNAKATYSLTLAPGLLFTQRQIPGSSTGSLLLNESKEDEVISGFDNYDEWMFYFDDPDYYLPNY